MQEVGYFSIPGDATRREFAVYVLAAKRRQTRRISFYVGKTGDNREGCNPVISRAGNHFSYNKIHSQMRNHLQPNDPREYDFHYFYVTFGPYSTSSRKNRGLVNLTNEMERRLNRKVQAELTSVGELCNPYRGSGYVDHNELKRRNSYGTARHDTLLKELIGRIQTWANRNRRV